MNKVLLHVDSLISYKNAVVGAKLSNPVTGESNIVKSNAFAALQNKNLGLDNGYVRQTSNSYTICSKGRPFKKVQAEDLNPDVLLKIGITPTVSRVCKAQMQRSMLAYNTLLGRTAAQNA